MEKKKVCPRITQVILYTIERYFPFNFIILIVYNKQDYIWRKESSQEGNVLELENVLWNITSFFVVWFLKT